MKNIIVDLLSAELAGKMSPVEIEKLIEIPPSEQMGDYAFPCFPLARAMRKAPPAIAQELAAKLKLPSQLESVKPISGYLNFYVNKKVLAEQVFSLAGTPDYGKGKMGMKIVVEFASPNTNKPLHLGHLRNISLGESVARILSFSGNQVTRTSINNDRGVHICKSMLAYRDFGEGKSPEQAGKKSDHFVGDFYVLFSKKAAQDDSWNQKAQSMLQDWEAGDRETVELWEKMNGWALSGFHQTYKLFGISFDKEYYESLIYKSGKEIVNEGLQRDVFSRREDNAVIVNLDDQKLGEKVLLRPNGTSVYIVQDLYLAVLKDQEYHYDKSIYVVGNEQEYHFAVLIAIFRKLGYPIADKMKHLSYGMVELPEGRMKSREGTVVDADDLIEETRKLAAAELKERYELTDEEMADRSLKIALSAIKYTLLKIDVSKNMLFDPKKAISFEGDTGPYLLYSYARASSILRKAGAPGSNTASGNPTEPETRLLKSLYSFPQTVAYAQDKLSPSVIANYAFDLAQGFNEFYHACQVIGSNEESFRLKLVEAFRAVLGKCLWLLGIETIEEM